MKKAELVVDSTIQETEGRRGYPEAPPSALVSNTLVTVAETLRSLPLPSKQKSTGLKFTSAQPRVSRTVSLQSSRDGNHVEEASWGPGFMCAFIFCQLVKGGFASPDPSQNGTGSGKQWAWQPGRQKPASPWQSSLGSGRAFGDWFPSSQS